MNVIVAVAVVVLVSSVYGDDKLESAQVKEALSMLEDAYCKQSKEAIDQCLSTTGTITEQVCECVKKATERDPICQRAYSEYLCNTVKINNPAPN
ncbi:unnamed protein product [Nippostrongylus brasiliensis]|uniref:AAI domain-containing protein n=1 Tax=Nippostrongylus brasiliensis TaxID=27835 RepID=A0A0N4YIM5_NIPBR|nr:unnamed protein product [Nippostrongylus brasiliensis]